MLVGVAPRSNFEEDHSKRKDVCEHVVNGRLLGEHLGRGPRDAADVSVRRLDLVLEFAQP
jgi:hypothetical protein